MNNIRDFNSFFEEVIFTTLDDEIDHSEWIYDNQGIETLTSFSQQEVLSLLRPLIETNSNRVQKGLEKLPSFYACLDASKPWLMFWIINALSLMNYPLSSPMVLRAIDTILRFKNEDGGFGGGPNQVSHLAPTYATIHCLALLGIPAIDKVVDRNKLLNFFLSLKQPDGSFVMSVGGEVDIRGSYCVVSCASLLNILTPELTKGIAGFVSRCQGFDGGLGCYPGVESHGGYTYCGLATLEILDSTNSIDIDHLLEWACNRQMSPEGGFQGRTNKLVDGCYSFWVGAIFPILQRYYGSELYNKSALNRYILNACQGPRGGLRDKPGKSADYYHTCYVVAGLSIVNYDYTYIKEKTPLEKYSAVSNEFGSLLKPTHPLYNIPISIAKETLEHYNK